MNEQIGKLIDQIATELRPQFDAFTRQQKSNRYTNLSESSVASTSATSFSDDRLKIGSIPKAGSLSKSTLARMIDHTLLKPEATKDQIQRLCQEAKEYHFATVCVNPYWVKHCVSLLQDSDVGVCSVVGFPLGANSPYIKTEEAKKAVVVGATEIDMVINVGRLKSGDVIAVRNEIHRVVSAVHPVTVKVIIETCLLTDEEKIKACLVARNARAHFVKTSTGFSTGGATPEDVALMRQVVGKDMGVKASGGIRTFQTALSMILAGANRLGASASIAIIAEA